MIIKKVITDSCRYKYYSITQDENRFIVRILTPSVGIVDNQLGLNSLLSTYCNLGAAFNVGNDVLISVAVGEFDKRIHTNLWKAGSILYFYLDTTSIGRKTVEILDINSVLSLTGETEEEYIKRTGIVVLAKLCCSNEIDSVIESDKQILIDTKGRQFTNIDLSNSVEVDEEDYLFGFSYKLEIPSVLEPNKIYLGKLHVMINSSDRVNGKFKVKSDSGYIPDTDVIVNNGVGEFKFITLGLNSSDSIKISAGSIHNSNLVYIENKLS